MLVKHDCIISHQFRVIFYYTRKQLTKALKLFFNITGLKVNDQLVAHATRFLALPLKKYVWSHHRALKAKVQYDFSSTYSPDHVLTYSD